MPKFLCIAVIAVVSSLPATSFAHAAYKDSSPRDEESVAAAPDSVWAEYTEPLQDGSHMEIYDPCGTRVDHDDTQITGYRMTISMTGEYAGTYRVSWVAASAIDPHVTRGVFTFTVTDGPACAAAAEDPEEAAAEKEPRAAGTRSEGTASREAMTERRPAAGSDRVKGRRLQTRARAGGRDAVAQEEIPVERTTERVGIWEGMPWDWFAIAMLIAALIGAAGGRIYAGIMGPRR